MMTERTKAGPAVPSDVDVPKVARLIDALSSLGSVVVAFSGGADSALLLATSLQVLGRDTVLAVTADSPTLPRSELEDTVALAKELGAEHLVVTTDELALEGFASNPPSRCYYCKQALFAKLQSIAEARGYEQVIYGATAADLGDHRPGMRAAEEAGAVAPLLQAGFTKGDVRRLSRKLGLRTWDKPAMACLSSRLPYGQRITRSKLAEIEAAEQLLRGELGFSQVRVRHHDTIARIEVPAAELGRMVEPSTARAVVLGLKELGFAYVTIDLQGFRSGSMNETIPQEEGARG